MTTPWQERFWANVYKTDSGCWYWTGYIHKLYGYGMFNRGPGNGTRRAHKIAWELVHGPVPDGLEILHDCDVRHCVNVEGCLSLGTHAKNMEDQRARGRDGHGVLPGELNPAAKLTVEAIAEIRQLYQTGDWRQKDLGAKFGVTQSHISSITRGTSWT